MTGPAGLRLDKWLWYARFCKSRSLAQKFCEAGRIRMGGTAVTKAHQPVRPGDVLTFPLGPHVRVIKVANLGLRRGPAAEARTLYEDLAPPPPQALPADTRMAWRPSGAGRPTKADRRATERLRGRA
ncbi:MAG: RNA-binding S4 domain-containing protein [Dongiaceae bacterium]